MASRTIDEHYQYFLVDFGESAQYTLRNSIKRGVYALGRSIWRWLRRAVVRNAAGPATTVILTLSVATVAASAVPIGLVSTKQIYYNDQAEYKVPGFVQYNTTYLPIWYVMQVLRKACFSTTWTGREWDISTSARVTSISFQPATSRERAVVFNGILQAKVSSFVYGGTTYMPVWYVMSVLRKAGLTTTWDGTTWRISGKLSSTKTPVPPSSGTSTGEGGAPPVTPVGEKGSNRPTVPIVLGFTPVYNGQTESMADVTARAQSINQFASFSADINADGTVHGAVPTDITTLASSVQAAVYPTVANTTASGFSGNTVVQVLSQPASRSTLIRNLVSMASQPHLAGINLDFENLPPTAKTMYTSFLADLHRQLAAIHKSLCVDVPAETGTTALESYDGAYDYSAIAQNSDMVMVMAYDYSYPGGPPGAIAPVSWVDAVIGYAVNSIPSDHVLMGLPAYGYDWSNGHTKAWSLPALDAAWQGLGAVRGWDAADQAPYLTYKDSSGTTHTVFYENAESMQAKIAIAEKYHVAGVAVWRVGLEDSAVWGPIAAYAKTSSSST